MLAKPSRVPSGDPAAAREYAAPVPGAAQAGWWRHPAVLSAALTAAAAVLWIAVFPRVGTDLSAGVARAGWAGTHPATGYVLSWYGGTYPAGYSLLAPYLLALAGPWAAMAAAAVICAGLLGLLLARHGAPRPRAAAVCTAAAVAAQLTAGRASFTLGLAAGLGALTAADRLPPWHWPRWLTVAALAALTSLLSPVAGLLLGVPAAAFLLTGRRNEGLVTGLSAAVPLVVTVLIPGAGPQPLPVQTWLPSLVAAAGVLVLVPRRWRMVRAGAAVYGLAVLAALAVPTPVGSNVERLGLLVACPLLVGLGSTRHRALFAAGVAAAAAWLAAQPAADLAHGNAPPFAPQTSALVRELRTLHAQTGRVEAVPQYGHWESQELLASVWLARGWERQLDIARNPLFYRGTLTPEAYYGWLRANAVRYVALSSGPPDWAGVAESQLVREGQPWLVPVWHNATWRLYRVAGTDPLASPPATVVTTGPARMVLRVTRPGSTLVRVYWSPLLRVTGPARVAADGRWIRVSARRAGTYTLTAPY
jgi:hypothetical protein